MLILMHLLVVHRFALCFYHLMEPTLWAMVVDFLRALGAAGLAQQFLYHQKLLHTNLYQSQTVYDSPEQRDNHRVILRSSMFLASLGWIYVACRFVHDIVVIFDDSSPHYLSNHVEIAYYGLHMDSPDALWIKILVIATQAIDRFLISGTTFFGISLYVVLCLAGMYHIRFYNNFFNLCHNLKVNLDTTLIRKWSLNRVDLNRIISSIEDLFSPLVFMWFALYAIGFCFKILQFMDPDPSKSKDAKFLLTVVDLLYINAWMATISVMGALIQEESRLSPHAVHSYVSLQPATTPCHFKHQAHLLCLMQTDPPLVMTAHSFFEIRKGLVISTLAGVATYLLIIVSWKGIHE